MGSDTMTYDYTCTTCGEPCAIDGCSEHPGSVTFAAADWYGDLESTGPNEPMTPPWIRQDGPATYSVSRKGGAQEGQNVR